MSINLSSLSSHATKQFSDSYLTGDFMLGVFMAVRMVLGGNSFRKPRIGPCRTVD